MNTNAESPTREQIYLALKRPFPADKISWRVGATNKEKTQGIALAYIDARDVMERLDEVFGLDWQCKYSHADAKTICEIGVLIEGEWVWRSGGAGNTDVEAEKGAISDAFKRAAVLFGIGRYLYSLPSVWVPIKEHGRSYTLVKSPSLPKWATPEGWAAPTPATQSKTPTSGAIENIDADRIVELTAVKTTIVDLYEKDLIADAHDAFYDIEDTEEKIAVWEMLKGHSKARRAIKEYHDSLQQSEQLEKEAA